jgi:hypothetical protein
MHLDLRPLNVGELFDRAFTLYRRNLWLFVGIIALPAVFALATAILMQVAQRMTMTDFAAVKDDPELTAATGLAILGLFGGVFIMAIMYWVVYMIALGAATHAVSELYVGRLSSVKQAYAGMRGRVGALIVLLLLVGLRIGAVGVGAGVVLAIGAGIGAVLHPVISGLVVMFGLLFLFLGIGFMMLRYGMTVPALVVEQLSPGDAIRRSVELTKARLLRVLLLVVCAFVLNVAAMMIFQWPFQIGAFAAGPESTLGFWLNIAAAVTGTIGTTFTTPFLVIGLALLYYDARIREEGFDLELTLAALDARTVAARA